MSDAEEAPASPVAKVMESGEPESEAPPDSSDGQAGTVVSKLGKFLDEAKESMGAHDQKITELKSKRSEATKAKRVLSTQMKQEKRKRARTDKVLARKPTWNLVAELEKRLGSSPSGSAVPKKSKAPET